MGLRYYSRSGWAFSANSCRADLLGHMHRLAGASGSKRSVLQPAYPRAVFVADAEECRVNAAKIAALSDEQIATLLEKPTVRECTRATPEEPAELVALARSWQAFLEVCGGYDTDPEWTLPDEQGWKDWEFKR